MTPEQAKEFGAYVRQKREESGISIRGLSGRVGIDQAQILRLEQGKVASPRADLLERIAHEVGIPVADLLTLAGYPTGHALPQFRPYMRAKYADLPPEAVDEVEAFIATLQAKHGSTAPTNGEDET